jgi:hypothetical protein
MNKIATGTILQRNCNKGRWNDNTGLNKIPLMFPYFVNAYEIRRNSFEFRMSLYTGWETVAQCFDREANASFSLIEYDAQHENDSCYGMLLFSVLQFPRHSLHWSTLGYLTTLFKLQRFYIGMELTKAMEMAAIRPASLADPSCPGIEPCLASRWNCKVRRDTSPLVSWYLLSEERMCSKYRGVQNRAASTGKAAPNFLTTRLQTAFETTVTQWSSVSTVFRPYMTCCTVAAERPKSLNLKHSLVLPGIFILTRVWVSCTRWELCIEHGGSHFEQFL